MWYEQSDYKQLNKYLDVAVTTKFEDLELEWRTACKVSCWTHYICKLQGSHTTNVLF